MLGWRRRMTVNDGNLDDDLALQTVPEAATGAVGSGDGPGAPREPARGTGPAEAATLSGPPIPHPSFRPPGPLPAREGSPSGPATAAPPPTAAATPPAAASAAAQARAGRFEGTLVGRGVVLEGVLRFSGTGRITGTLRGEVEAAGILEVGEGGTVLARLTVDDLRVSGEVRGDVTVRNDAELLPGGRLVGTLRTSSLHVHRGAVLDGQCTMGLAPSPAAAAPASVPAGGSKGKSP